MLQVKMDESIEKNKETPPASPNTTPSFLRKMGFELREFLKIALISLAVVLPVRFFVAQPFVVRGASMEPNFQEGQYLIIDEASYYFRAPERGEIVVFRYPNEPSEFFIKRIIGLPGEQVEVRDGKVWIINHNHPGGFALTEPYLPSDELTTYDTSVTLADQQYFVLGDNRVFSSDSRRWGPLDKKYLTGRVLLRLWPVAQAGGIPRPTY